MKLALNGKAKTDLKIWYGTGRRSREKIEHLLKEIMEHPRWGTGKPERLKHFDGETWSRRIDRKNRIIYEIDEEKSTVFILSLTGHYEKEC